jgi:hypothetical protein
MSVLTTHQTDLTTFCRFKRVPSLCRALHFLLNRKSDPMNHLNEVELRDRCERYVAATRVREYLLVTANGNGD